MFIELHQICFVHLLWPGAAVKGKSPGDSQESPNQQHTNITTHISECKGTKASRFLLCEL